MTTSKATESFGVKLPVKAVNTPAAGFQEHFATNGATSVVATFSQPTIATPAAKNFTLPALFAVAVIAIGSN